jgi:REP element-mobilizing transposase RayT
MGAHSEIPITLPAQEQVYCRLDRDRSNQSTSREIMPAQRKLFQTGNVYEVCTRLQYGLPLTAHPSAKTLIKGMLARAQGLYPVTISHFIFMANHFHMIVVAQNPEDIPNFMEYFKAQTSRVLNILFGLSGKSWAERYDSPCVLDLNKLLDRLEYLYTNPQSAHLVDTIDHYPHVSSWNQMISGIQLLNTKETKHSISSLSLLVSSAKRTFSRYPLLPYQTQNETLTIDTAAAFRALGIEDDNEIQDYLTEVISRVRAKEKELSKERQLASRQVLGKHALIEASPLKQYQAKKTLPRMLCLGSCRNQRADYISWYKNWNAACREVYESWRDGITAAFPSLGFPPRNPFCERYDFAT